jgi:NagD protein
MLSGIMQRYGLRADEIAMVGDRIYTDVQMAFNAGAFGVLVLSGETTLDIVAEAPRKPDLTADSIAVLGDLLAQARE